MGLYLWSKEAIRDYGFISGDFQECKLICVNLVLQDYQNQWGEGKLKGGLVSTGSNLPDMPA